MAAYLIVDVDDLVVQFANKGITLDLQELAVGLRGGAALAAGLASADKLRAVAVAHWGQYDRDDNVQGMDPKVLFRTAGYDVFDVPDRDSLADALIVHYFAFDPDPVNELIIATTSTDLIPLVRRVKTTASARVRVWGTWDVLEGTEFADDVIFQPFESLLGIQTKNVAVYIDFENIAISLNEQGFTVNLDHLIDRFVKQAKAHGNVVQMAAYAPWGQRGTLPPLVDSTGHEVAEEAPSRLMIANIEPVFNLPGKNSADIRIARDVMTHSGYEGADVYILASGDRDFNDVLNSLVTRGKQVIVWGVRGSTSRQLAQNPGVTVEYIEDFTKLQTHASFGTAVSEAPPTTENFTPSQWSSLVTQFDRLADEREVNVLSTDNLTAQLRRVGAVVSDARGEDLISQAMSLGILKPVSANGRIRLNSTHPIVEKTRIVRDRIVVRVKNTLRVRGWEYVNYGFLLKGLAMDHELDGPGLNVNDQWRSHWIDALVREQILSRELVPHRQNPDDLVPVIKMRADYEPQIVSEIGNDPLEQEDRTWSTYSLNDLIEEEPTTAEMVYRVVVSVEQFTSFRGFDWCPLGSLHRRLRDFDQSMSFQRAVEYLMEHNAATVDEYDNPQSEYQTKGISINEDTPISEHILRERDDFIKILLNLYEQNMLISQQNLQRIVGEGAWNLSLWFSIMETENILNSIPARQGQFSLFRTHHTVNLVAEATGRTNDPGQ
jgi:hypothetical protein